MPAVRDRAVTGADARRARVHGVVVDEAGKPVAGIEVRDAQRSLSRAVSRTSTAGSIFAIRRPLLNGTCFWPARRTAPGKGSIDMTSSCSKPRRSSPSRSC